MEQTNTSLATISLKDTGLLSNYSKNIALLLKKNNITTVEELFQFENTDAFVFIRHYKTKNELMGLIELLKYKYLHQPLSTASYLEDVLVPQPINFKIQPNTYPDHLKDIPFARMGFCSYEQDLIKEFALKIQQEITLYDLFCNIVSTIQENRKQKTIFQKVFIHKLILYIHYDRFKNQSLEEKEQWKLLRNELETIIKKRNQLDQQITLTTQELSLLNPEYPQKSSR